MGTVGSTCWFVQAALMGFWASIGLRPDDEDDQYCGWAAASLSVMAVGTLFLVIVFARLNVAVITKRNPTIKANHFLVPAMMLGIVAEFVSAAASKDVGPTQKMIRYVR